MTPSTTTLLVFRIGASWLAVQAKHVHSLIDLLPVTPIPRVPSHIRGLVAYRGQAVPILDLSSFLELPAGPESSNEVADRLVVLSTGAMTVGLFCQRVDGISEVAGEALHEVRLVAGRLRQFTQAELEQSERVVALLDTEALLEAARVA